MTIDSQHRSQETIGSSGGVGDDELILACNGLRRDFEIGAKSVLIRMRCSRMFGFAVIWRRRCPKDCAQPQKPDKDRSVFHLRVSKLVDQCRNLEGMGTNDVSS